MGGRTPYYAGEKISDINFFYAWFENGNGSQVRGTFTLDNPDQVLTEGNNTISWTFTPEDSANYEVRKGSNVVVAKRNPNPVPNWGGTGSGSDSSESSDFGGDEWEAYWFDFAVVSNHKHKFGAWKTTSKATVFSPKLQTRKCKKCSYKETRKVGRKLKATLSLSKTKITFSGSKRSAVVKASRLNKGDSIVSFRSSNPNVATVTKKGGKSFRIVAGNVAGSAKVTIRTKAGAQKTFTPWYREKTGMYKFVSNVK